jgi:hypothetical protein
MSSLGMAALVTQGRAVTGLHGMRDLEQKRVFARNRAGQVLVPSYARVEQRPRRGCRWFVGAVVSNRLLQTAPSSPQATVAREQVWSTNGKARG